MGISLRTLIVEDNEDDAQLVLRLLRKGGFDPAYERVDTAIAMREAVGREKWDVIISDFNMPHFSGLAAIELYQEKGLDIPFIIVSGTIGEEAAVAAMRLGAHDYVMKNNLPRLVPAIQRELREAESRKEHKIAEAALRESEERINKAFRSIPDALIISRLEDGKIIEINDSWDKVFGYSRDEVIGKSSLALNLFADLSDRQRTTALLQKQGFVRDFELQIRQKSGVLRMASLSAELLEIQGEQCLLTVIQDVTERKLAEKALKESEKNYRLLADNVEDVIFVLDVDLNYSYVSPSVKILRGYEPEELLKQSSIETLMRSSRDLAIRTFSDIMDQEKSGGGEISLHRTLELEMGRKDGTTVWTEVKFSSIRDENRRLVGITGIARDISERRAAEQRIRKALEATVQAIAVTVETRDPYTAGHQRRVADLARRLAMEMNLSSDMAEGIRMAATIHDIGKISVPAELLSKPTALTDIEFMLIKTHSQGGYNILKDIDFPWPVARIVLEHHERMNGSGYPNGLAGEKILMESRILSVADIVEAMASDRPYRASLGIDAALNEILRNKGILYDPEVSDACLRLFRDKGYKMID
ncbi:MAG: PAS domain S-box protein [Candidatus Aminicenantales bacterium]